MDNVILMPGQFLSTLSLRRATCYSFRHSASCWYFYPRSPCGERQRLWIMLYSCPGNFYPRSPCGERLAGVNSMLTLIQFLSTLSLRRATTCVLIIRKQCRHFYPRSPCGERPVTATLGMAGFHFYPRSPCGERPGHPAPCRSAPSISIHALLAESDLIAVSVRGGIGISIHALLAESDPAVLPHPARGKYFYPRSPCGERRTASTGDYLTANISIHALLAESDGGIPCDVPVVQISIHALLAESDGTGSGNRSHRQPFLSTLSLRRATRRFQ